ncbi:MAG: glycosyltransferase family 2 protein [Lachnospiraceae bacterium]|nr:glycosyltransferase family 2 protein [Lachnospiraceae bacterium]
MKKEISVILINYNGKKYNDACISSILGSTIAKRIQIVVVDNASTDDSLSALRGRWGGHEQIHLIELNDNYGFSKANNEGIRWSMEQGIDYYLLLNNDTEIEPDTIEQMMRCGQKTKNIVVPKVLYADRKNVIWCAGGTFTPVLWKTIQSGLDQTDSGQFDVSGECLFANGCALLLSREIVERTGFLDERFFLYYEDVEYSMRAAQNSIGIYYCAEAVVYHKVNGSTGGNERPANAYYITRNWLLCNSLCMWHGEAISGKLRFLLFIAYFACNRLAWLLIWFIQGKRGMCTALLQGVRDFNRKKWGQY